MSKSTLKYAMHCVWVSLLSPSLAALSAAAHGQAASRPQTPSPTPTLAPVVVTATPLGSDLFDLVTPASVLEGARLRERMAPTLGEMLADEVGVSASGFGPNASRPIIRGLDGDRVRILQNGVGALDASATSVDHAVATEPLTTERVEILRGPATLLYGGNAVGGVVNVIDGRIVTERLGKSVEGSLDLRYGTAANERSEALRLRASDGRVVLSVDGFNRRTGDLKIPDFARSRRERERKPLAAGETEVRGSLVNSSSASDGGGLGLSVLHDRGYNGFAFSQTSHRYGTVAEPDVRIGMQQSRYEFAGEQRSDGFLRAIRYKAAYSDYQHVEYESFTQPATTFTNKGFDSRLEFVHNRVGVFEGAFGVQLQRFRFAALGDEGFLPRTNTAATAAFLYEEATFGAAKFTAGLRAESVEVGAEEDARFGGARTRRFAPKSGSLGALYTVARDYAVFSNVSYTERAPTYQELFANGRHIATRAFEVGDRELKLERSMAFDFGLRKRGGPLTGTVNVFYNRFRDFVTLVPNGTDDGDPVNPLPVFDYRHVPAVFRGLEGQLAYIAYERAGRRLTVDLRGDYTRARNRDTGEPLPRIAPHRFGGGISYQVDRTTARLDLMRVGAQNRVAENELPTDRSTMLNATISHTLRSGGAPGAGTEWTAYLRGVNLLNQEARSHTSFLKDVAPLSGRGVVVGLRGSF